MEPKNEGAQVAIVIGAGSPEGVGGALCRRFAREGLRVVAVGRTQAKLDALAATIAGGVVTPVAGDATDERDVARVFDAAQELGRVGLVVFNAGNAYVHGFTDMSAAFFEQAWRVCCLGGFLVGRETARRLVPGGGTLIFTGATASLRARPPFTAFASAKAALRAVAHGMAREFGPQKLHVAHVIVDGAIDGEQINARIPSLRERLGQGGMLAPDAIADAYWMLHVQDPSAWTLELDLRPFKESF
jgi:NAD(P)-dependent dehydrogenase (short-subunit alcohol dehydrogenase family)